jgi:hypothetical protein
MQEGYFVAFRNVGLPIRTEDYDNPHSPIGVNLNEDRRTPRRPRRAARRCSDASTRWSRDTLARIARKLYGDGKRWPDIATANNLADPGRIRPGQILLIPQEFPRPVRTVVRSCGG